MKLVLVLALLLASGSAWGLTEVRGTVRDPFGVAASATAEITWTSFTSAAGVFVPAGQRRVAVTSGLFRVLLEPNAGATPTGTSYSVKWEVAGVRSTETWVVPVAFSTTIGAVRTSPAPFPAPYFSLAALTQSGATPGQVPTWDAVTGWTPATAGGGNVATYDGAGPFTVPQTISGSISDLLSLNNSGGSDWVTLLTNKSRVKVWSTGLAGLAEFQALGFFGSGAGLTAIPSSALVDGGLLPSTSEKAALPGTSGTPSGSNKYVTDADARNADARAPTVHNTSHKNGGADEVATATAAANAIPKAGADARLAVGWIPVVVSTADLGYFVGVSIWPIHSTTTNTAVFSANQVKVWQFVLPFPATIGRITFDVVTPSGTCAGTCSAQLGLWTSDLATVAIATGVMTSGGTPNINSTAVLSLSVSAVTLNSGVYNLVLTTDSTVLVLRGMSPPSQQINQLNAQTIDKWGTCANAGAAGALPASCGTVTASTAVPPLVTFER